MKCKINSKDILINIILYLDNSIDKICNWLFKNLIKEI